MSLTVNKESQAAFSSGLSCRPLLLTVARPQMKHFLRMKHCTEFLQRAGYLIGLVAVAKALLDWQSIPYAFRIRLLLSPYSRRRLVRKESNTFWGRPVRFFRLFQRHHGKAGPVLYYLLLEISIINCASAASLITGTQICMFYVYSTTANWLPLQSKTARRYALFLRMAIRTGH